MEILGFLLNTLIIVCLLALWRIAISAVEDKIIDIQIKADEDKVKPWLAAMVRTRFWRIIAMVLAPLLVVAYGVYIIVAALSLEAWDTIKEDSKRLVKRVQHR